MDELVDESEIAEEETATTAVEAPPKKRPGRPRKIIEKPDVPRLGIVTSPSNQSTEEDERMLYVFEMIYENPMMYEKIVSLYKAMSAEKVRMRFEKECIKIYARDNKEKNDIYTRVLGHRMNRYFCDHVLEFCIPTQRLEKVTKTICKDHNTVTMLMRKRFEKSRIIILLSEQSSGVVGEFNIEIESTTEPYDWSVEKELENEEYYPIKFEVSSKRLKKKVSDFATASDILRIEKDGDDPLRFSCNFTDRHGQYNEHFNYPGVVNLRSLLDEGEIFSSSVHFENIKPLASSLISDTIHISADKERKMIFTARLDEEEENNTKKTKKYGTHKCEIKVLTQIVRADKQK